MNSYGCFETFERRIRPTLCHRQTGRSVTSTGHETSDCLITNGVNSFFATVRAASNLESPVHIAGQNSNERGSCPISAQRETNGCHILVKVRPFASRRINPQALACEVESFWDKPVLLYLWGADLFGFPFWNLPKRPFAKASTHLSICNVANHD